MLRLILDSTDPAGRQDLDLSKAAPCLEPGIVL